MNKTDRQVKELHTLMREWNFHNNKHHCYYLESDDSGVAECPGMEFNVFAEFAVARHGKFSPDAWTQFSDELVADGISGRIFGQPNSRSEIPVEEIPVEPFVGDEEMAEYDMRPIYQSFLRHRKPVDNLSPVARYMAGMDKDPQDPSDTRMVNEQPEVDELGLRIISSLLEGITKNLWTINQRLERIEDALAERQRSGLSDVYGAASNQEIVTAVKDAMKEVESKRETLARRAGRDNA